MTRVAAGSNDSNLTARIAAYAAAACSTPLAEDVAHKAQHHLLDTIAAMVSGSTLPAGVAARKFAGETAGRPVASVVMSGLRTNSVDAALANAMAAHADETDDAHPASITHPGCAVVPAALAAAEAVGASGAQFLRAVALGYDICARFGIAVGAGQFLTERGFDPHAFGGVFGAAAAAGALATPDPTKMTHVFSYAAQQASGLATLFRDREHIEKAFVFAGMPARNGVAAAMMVRSGMPGVADVFDGDPSFLSAFGIDREKAALFDDLGQTFEITHTNIKRWSVGSPVQAALDSLEAMISEHGVRARDVASVTIHLPSEGAQVVNDRKMPSVNAQHLAALMLVDGTIGFISSHDEVRMRDPDVFALRQRVTLSAHEELSRTAVSRQAIVDLHLHDGRKLSHRTHAVRGTVKNPMSRPEVEAKALDLMQPLLGAEAARRGVDMIWNIESAASLAPLAALIGEASKQKI